MRAIAIVLGLLLSAGTAAAQTAAEPLSKTCRVTRPDDVELQKIQPVKVFDNLYYVGPCYVSVWLVTTPAGHILFDSAQEPYVDHVIAGIKKFGINLRDIKYIVLSHGHLDHVGGAARLQELTGARVVAIAEDWAMIEKLNGANSRRDPGRPTRTPKRDMVVKEGDTLTLGDQNLRFHQLPGHTPGVLVTEGIVLRDGGRTYRGILPAGGDGGPGLAGAEQFVKNAAILGAIQGVQVNLQTHSWAEPDGYPGGGVIERMQRLRTRTPGDAHPLVDPDTWHSRVKETVARAARTLAAERAKAGASSSAAPAAPSVAPGSINAEDVPYPHPVSYLRLTLYTQDVRMAYMDVAPLGTPNGRTVVLLHGNNFAGFYFGGPIDALRREGFRVVVPDQIGYGRSSKPFIPYNLHDMARNTRLLLQSLKIEKAMVVGHSMGGMVATRFSTQYPDVVERLVLYNPIGLVDQRFTRPWQDTDEGYTQNLAATWQTTRAGIGRYVAHNPASWNDEFEKYTRYRYSWTLGAEWPRLAMVQALLSQVIYADAVVNDWDHIKAPTLLFGGAEDVLPGSAALFQQRMKYVAERIPNGRGRLHLIPGLGHVPHLEAPEQIYPPLVAFLKEGLAGS
jgi:pimeloyl-ACP methyl ester carboxylesterase